MAAAVRRTLLALRLRQLACPAAPRTLAEVSAAAAAALRAGASCCSRTRLACWGEGRRTPHRTASAGAAWCHGRMVWPEAHCTGKMAPPDAPCPHSRGPAMALREGLRLRVAVARPGAAAVALVPGFRSGADEFAEGGAAEARRERAEAAARRVRVVVVARCAETSRRARPVAAERHSQDIPPVHCCSLGRSDDCLHRSDRRHLSRSPRRSGHLLHHSDPAPRRTSRHCHRGSDRRPRCTGRGSPLRRHRRHTCRFHRHSDHRRRRSDVVDRRLWDRHHICRTLLQDRRAHRRRIHHRRRSDDRAGIHRAHAACLPAAATSEWSVAAGQPLPWPVPPCAAPACPRRPMPKPAPVPAQLQVLVGNGCRVQAARRHPTALT